MKKRIAAITTVEQAEQIDISSLVIPEFTLDKTVFEDPENPKPEECLHVVDQFFGMVQWEEDPETQSIVDDFFSQVKANAEDEPEQMENLVAVDESDPLTMIAELENLVAVDEDQQDNLVAADESDPLTMIAELENLVAVDEDQQDNLVAADESDPLTMIAGIGKPSCGG